MRLKDPTQHAQVRLTIQSQMASCESLSQTQPRGMLQAYFNWARSTHMNLAGSFVDEEIADDVYGQAYYKIVGMDEGTRGLRELLNVEATRIRARFTAIIDQLDRWQAFRQIPGTPTIVDTSALMLGDNIGDIRWPEQLGTHSVRLILPIIVIEELDGLKDSERNTTKSDRARGVLRKVRDLVGDDPATPVRIRDQCTVEILLDQDWQLRRPENDGEIIEQALSVQNMIGGGDVRLVTADTAMWLRAKTRGLKPHLLEPATRSSPTATPSP